MKNKLKKQFLKLLEEPLFFSRLTDELYIELHTKGSMIAHFNKEGFHKSRFWKLDDFDQTINSIRVSKSIQYLLKDIDPNLIGQARFKIAQTEAHILRKQAEIMIYHANQLQTKFTKEF